MVPLLLHRGASGTADSQHQRYEAPHVTVTIPFVLLPKFQPTLEEATRPIDTARVGHIWDRVMVGRDTSDKQLAGEREGRGEIRQKEENCERERERGRAGERIRVNWSGCRGMECGVELANEVWSG